MIARLHDERGVTLLESLVAVAIMGLTLIVFMAAMQTGLLSTSSSDRLSTAHELARSQMEYTKASPYVAAPHSYVTVTPPAGYAVSADGSAISGGDANIQLVTVQVTRDGVAVYTLEGYKVNR